jgi:threonine synthase
MSMQYISTRGGCAPCSFSEAVAMGLAPDGGLFVPRELPDLSAHLDAWKDLPYAALCERFMALFADDLPAGVLKSCVTQAYTSFDHPDIAPIRSLDKNLHVCELFHGPTLAFKDFALQLLGQLYASQIAGHGRSLTVLGATSGDTGSAAIHGLMNLPGIRLFILYPRGGVAPLQERQMACTGSSSVYPIAIDGSFDDAQKWVKALFGEPAFRDRHHLSAINSINLARVLAQCVYYLYAWFRIPEAQRAELEVVVPTGNFGNVLAGWMLTRMGVPFHRFCIATNQNDILYRLFQDGCYRQSQVLPSVAPSMDIQVASNFERLIHFMAGGDASKVREVMQRFLTTGEYRFPDFAPGCFCATRADDADILRNIREVHRRYGYVVDPHTACAFNETVTGHPRLIMATAHPAKFPDAIQQAIGVSVTHPRLEALKTLPLVRHELPSDLDAIRSFVDAAD